MNTLTMIAAVGEAVTPAIDLTTPFQTGINTTVTTTLQLFSIALPVGITIFTAKFAWLKGVQFFSKLAKAS